MENIEIANIFEEVADLLDIQGGSPFRVRAYRTAARTIGTLGTPVEDLLRSGPAALEELPGIGADLAGKIEVICKTGALPLVHQLSRKTPESLVALLRIPGLGPKRAKIIYDELGVKTIAQLEKAARSGRLATLHGFGPKTAEAVLHGIQQQKAHGSRTPLADAEAYVRPLIEALEAVSGVKRIEIAGSYRRRAETVGDVDILVASSRPAPIADRFLHHPSVGRVLAQGTTRCSVVLTSGLQVDLRIVRPVSFGAALHYFTGSKPHNIAVRAMGVRKGLKINEYGVFRGSRRIGGRTEAEVYKAVGLTWMPPELRENRGELEASRDGTLPNLVELDDLCGDLQMHTTYTDGQNTVAEMVEACARARL